MHARTKCVGNSQPCMVQSGRMIVARTSKAGSAGVGGRLRGRVGIACTALHALYPG